MSVGRYHIRSATPADAEALAEFAARTFSDTFAAANRPEDIAAYLPSAYSTPQQASELADASISTLIIERSSDATWLAFAMLRSGEPPACVTGPAPLEIWRFYVDRPWHGLGLAHELMVAVRQTAIDRGAKTLWLGVWEQNPRAIAFYAKCGFTDVGAHDFWVGSDRQSDRIMVRDLRSEV